MSLRLKTLVLAAALLVMPLQGTAATLSAILCHGDAQAHLMHSNGTEDPAAHGKGQPSDGGMGGNPSYHPCCHNIVSAAPATVLPTAQPEFPVRAFAPDAVQDLFVPERPQRPPLA